MKKKNILVTGSHRSGSTWVGSMLSLTANVHYYHEPFNPNLTKIDNPIEYWFDYVYENDKKQKSYKHYINVITKVRPSQVRLFFKQFKKKEILLR